MTGVRLIRAVHSLRDPLPDPEFEPGLSAELRERLDPDQIRELFYQFSGGNGYIDALMRRAALRALARGFGMGVTVGRNVDLTHPETFEFGDRVFIGDQVVLQGRFDGRCVIGKGVWIGPQSYFDARDLVIGDQVGWGPGAKVLGSEHTGLPINVPVIQTDLEVLPVRIGDWADIGVSAIIMPGVTVGRGSIVGAGAVVTRDVPDFAKVAGIPARVIGWRDDRAVPEQTVSDDACEPP